MALYEALYWFGFKSLISWFELGEVALIRSYLVHEAKEKVQLIKDKLKIAESRQKSYADVRKRYFEFEIDDWVFVSVSSMKGVMRFCKKGKLSPRYAGLYRFLKRICNVSYELEFPKKLAAVHLVFHISLMKKCMGDPTSIVPFERGCKR